jgi:tRNA (guanine37-N1)-methyltransferase
MAPGVLSNNECFMEESHFNGLLEYPQYTKPQDWRGHQVPPVLYSGDHAKVDRWRYEHSLIATAEKRPDMLEKKELSKEDKEIIENYFNIDKQ